MFTPSILNTEKNPIAPRSRHRIMWVTLFNTIRFLNWTRHICWKRNCRCYMVIFFFCYRLWLEYGKRFHKKKVYLKYRYLYIQIYNFFKFYVQSIAVHYKSQKSYILVYLKLIYKIWSTIKPLSTQLPKIQWEYLKLNHFL